MLELKIQKKSDFVEFIDSISKINDSAIINICEGSPGMLSTIVSSEDNTLILYTETEVIVASGNSKCNIPDLKKLTRIVDSINEEEFNLSVNANNIEYIGDGMKFKYHLYEDGFLSNPSINIDKIKNFNYDITFTLTRENIQSILRGCAFATQSNKVYLYTEDGVLKAELTDRAKHNVDVLCRTLCKVNFEMTPIPINIDNIKLISLLSDEITVNINTSFGVVIFDIIHSKTKLKYILSTLTQ